MVILESVFAWRNTDYFFESRGKVALGTEFQRVADLQIGQIRGLEHVLGPADPELVGILRQRFPGFFTEECREILRRQIYGLRQLFNRDLAREPCIDLMDTVSYGIGINGKNLNGYALHAFRKRTERVVGQPVEFLALMAGL